MNTTPPIAGVPVLPSFEASPRERMGCPALSALKTRIATGVPNREMTNATAAATMTALTGAPPRDPDYSRRPTTQSVSDESASLITGHDLATRRQPERPWARFVGPAEPTTEPQAADRNRRGASQD